MSLQTPTGPRSDRSTPAANTSAFSPPPMTVTSSLHTGVSSPAMATPAEEGVHSPARVATTEPIIRASDSDTAVNTQQSVPKDPNRPRSNSNSRPGILASSKGSGRFSYDAEPSHFTGGSLKSHRPRFRDDWDDEDVAEHQSMKDYEYRPGRYTSRRGPWSRPPPALLNRNPSLNMNQEEYEDLMKANNEESRSIRDPFDTPRRRRTDEEMGLSSHSPPRPHLGRAYTGSISSRLPDWNTMTAEEKAEVLRLPLTHWMHSDFKNHFVATLGEFIGTTLFLFFAFAGTEVANIQSSASDDTTTGASTGFSVATLLYISLCFGFSLMVNVWVFFRISGGLFNPAVTMAMVMVQAITAARAICLFIAQILGSMLASVVVRYLFPESFAVRTTLGGGTSLAQGVFIEAILTAELVFTIFMLAKEKHRATFIAPVGIGLALFIAEMAGVQFTGGSLNPARSFGPCVITGTFESEHWIYWVGPFAGSIIAVLFYRFIKTLEYEMANPGADGDDFNDPTKNPEKRAEIRMAKSPSKTPSIRS
ncbi:Fc.00g028770.m01.CDS01 [Cosmosporella sp. VM-42]